MDILQVAAKDKKAVAELLDIDNVMVKHMPLNSTSLIQPIDQGVLRSLKCKYKALFLKRILNVCKNGGGVAAFQKEFPIKHPVWGAARAKEIPTKTLSNGWHKYIAVFGVEQELLDFAKGILPKILDEEAIAEMPTAMRLLFSN